MTKLTELTNDPVATPIAKDDLIYVVKPDGSKKVVANNILDVTKLAGDWDMSVTVDTPAEPSALVTQEASFTKTDDQNYEMTPVSGTHALKVIASSSGIKPTPLSQTARIRAPAAGGNLIGIGYAVVNAEASVAEVEASLLNGGAIGGNLTHMASGFFVMQSFGPFLAGSGSFIVGDANNTNGVADFVSGAGLAFTAGADELYFSFNGSTPGLCTLTIGKNAAPGLTSTLNFKADDLASSLRLHVLMLFSIPTVSFTGSMNFDMSTPDTGSPFVITQAQVPANSREGDRYRVSVGGEFAGQTTLAGDIVEFTNLTAGIVIYRLITDQHIIQLINNTIPNDARMTVIQSAKNRRLIFDITNDINLFYTYVRGDMVIAGPTPTGNLAGFTAWQPAIYDGTAWIQGNRDDFWGLRFTFGAVGSSTPIFELEFAQGAGGPDAFSGYDGGFSGMTQTYGSALVTESGLHANAGMKIHPLNDNGSQYVRVYEFVGIPADAIQVGDAEMVEVGVSNTAFNLIVNQVANSANQTTFALIRVLNIGGTPLNLMINGAKVDGLEVIEVLSDAYFLYCVSPRFPNGPQAVLPLIKRPLFRDVPEVREVNAGGTVTTNYREGHTAIRVTGGGAINVTVVPPTGCTIGERWTLTVRAIAGGSEVSTLAVNNLSATRFGAIFPTNIPTGERMTAEFTFATDGWVCVNAVAQVG